RRGGGAAAVCGPHPRRAADGGGDVQRRRVRLAVCGRARAAPRDGSVGGDGVAARRGGRVHEPGVRAHGLFPVGEARQLFAGGQPRAEGGDDGQAGVQSDGDRPGGHDAVCGGAAADAGAVLGVGRGGDVLPVHEVRASVYILAVQHYSAEPGRGAAQGVGDAVRDAADGGGVCGAGGDSEQARGRGGARVGRAPGGDGDVCGRARGGAGGGGVPQRPGHAVPGGSGGGAAAAGRAGPGAAVQHRGGGQACAGAGGQLRRGARADCGAAGGAARRAGAHGAAAAVPPGRGGDVSEHHSDEPAAAGRDGGRGGVRGVRLQRAGQDV
ncbi:hypothetical protein H4S02_013671, partial [Coemansia sp. RSA 2611]